MTRLKNKFFLILAGIVGLCLSFCTFLMPKKVDVASADTTSMVESSTHYYAYLPKNLDLSLIVLPQLPNGSLMAFQVFSNTTILGGSFARIRYVSINDTPGYISFFTSGKIGKDYFIPLSRGDLPITRIEICVITDSSGTETVTRYSYSNPINIVTFDYATDAFNNGYSSGYQEGYDVGEIDGFDGGYALGKTDGQKVEYITQNRGLWGDRFEFSWEYEGIPYTLNFGLSTDDYEVFIKGGIDFSKLQLVFREWCTLEGFHIPDVDATLITVKCPMVTNSLNPFVLWTGDKAFVGDGYYLCDGNYKWGSFQNIDEQYELSDVYEFETFSEMTVAPDSLTFTFQSSWDFFVYANDGSIGFTDYNVGYNQGFGNGYEQGYDEGYDEGDKLTSESLQNAYNDGYSVGISKAENFDFAYAVSTVIGAPVTVVKEFLSFEILGVNLISFISGLITLMIVVKCIKFFL